MATIKLTDDLGLDENVTLAPFSSLLKYAVALPALRAQGGDLSKAGGLTLDQPALTALNTGVSFDKTFPIGAAGVSLLAAAHGSLQLIARTPTQVTLPDVWTDDVEIADGTCFVAFGIDASVGVSAGTEAGLLKFGVGPGQTIEFRNYRSFPLHHEVTLAQAVGQTVGEFVIPACSADLASLPEGCVASVTGTGSLKLSAKTNLLALTNPLASVALPGPLPALSVTAGGAATIGASLELRSTFQICARKLDAGHVRLGWYCEKASEFAVTATVSEGVSAGFGATDLFSTIVGLISAQAAADLNELQKAGLPAGQIEAIQNAVKGAVNRNLEVALSTEISAVQSSDAIFLYDIDLGALTPESQQALDQALRGDLSGLHGGALGGVTAVQSVWEKARKNGIQLHVNLLGILNFGSISALASSGAVLLEPATGALVITDKTTAQRIRSTAVNFGADTQKLRHVMAESFLLTAAYQGSQQQVGGPALGCRHSFFDLNNNTSREGVGRELRVGTALGLFSADEAEPPAGIGNFGRTMVHASTEYDSALAAALFLGPGGEPFSQPWYEERGREAIQLLVSETDEDAVRRRPAIDDDLWRRMKETGQPGFASLFPHVAAPLLGAITADYTAIVWWAAAMAGAAERLLALRQFFQQRGPVSPDDPEFQNLRQDLAAHLKNVAATTSEQFGEPWGLVAMHQASDRRAAASILITGPKLVRSKQRPAVKHIAVQRGALT